MYITGTVAAFIAAALPFRMPKETNRITKSVYICRFTIDNRKLELLEEKQQLSSHHLQQELDNSDISLLYRLLTESINKLTVHPTLYQSEYTLKYS